MKATIIIPNINGKGWLKDSIESVYAQTEQDFELIVVDNGSTDESRPAAIAAARTSSSSRTALTPAFPTP
jgi:glycosyltransferase involved in cell wall biosynthesis